MTFTKLSTLIIFALSGAVLVGVGQWAATRLGENALIPPITWGVTLFLLGAIVISLAWPVRESVTRPVKTSLIDPLYATRVLLLAKASAVSGSGLAGGALGLGGFFLSRPVVSASALWAVGFALLGALVLMAGALLAERWCAYPPDDTGDNALEGEPS
jgi:hypothetical protein